MSTTEQDIIIVGGGISGAALAYGLSGKGRKVTVLDAPTDTNKASRTKRRADLVPVEIPAPARVREVGLRLPRGCTRR